MTAWYHLAVRVRVGARGKERVGVSRDGRVVSPGGARVDASLLRPELGLARHAFAPWRSSLRLAARARV